MASASAALNRINVAGGGADNTESTLWASLNAGSGSAADRLALIGQLTGLVEASIGSDTSAAQTAANDAAAAWAADALGEAKARITKSFGEKLEIEGYIGLVLEGIARGYVEAIKAYFEKFPPK